MFFNKQTEAQLIYDFFNFEKDPKELLDASQDLLCDCQDYIDKQIRNEGIGFVDGHEITLFKVATATIVIIITGSSKKKISKLVEMFNAWGKSGIIPQDSVLIIGEQRYKLS